MIIPVLLAGAGYSTAPDFVRHRQGVDMREGVSEEGIAQLIQAIESRRRRPS
ncbi:hypothetical protein ACLQ24_29230 [Micromonospora sp. DT4]|uniref:hypothetical protein n=1 Tax=Micromonospora sp. DT4 TaxID=3393438 RepID=UPI003CF61689